MRRVAIAGVIAMEPDYLILDEPSAGLDPISRDTIFKELNELYKERKIAVVLVTHSMDAVRKYCNRAMMIRDGEIIVSGDPLTVSGEYSLENIKDRKQISGQSEGEDKDSPVVDFNIVMRSKPVLKPGDTLEVDIIYNTSSDISTGIGVTIIDRGFNYNILNDGPETKDWITKKETLTRFRYEWKIPDISDRKLLIVASLYECTGSERKAIAFTGESRGVGFLVVNENTTSKALMAGRGIFNKVI